MVDGSLNNLHVLDNTSLLDMNSDAPALENNNANTHADGYLNNSVQQERDVV